MITVDRAVLVGGYGSAHPDISICALGHQNRAGTGAAPRIGVFIAVVPTLSEYRNMLKIILCMFNIVSMYFDES